MPRRSRPASDPASVHGFLDEVDDKDKRPARRGRRDPADEADLDLDKIW